MSREGYTDFLYSSKSVVTCPVISLGPGFDPAPLSGWLFPEVWVQLWNTEHNSVVLLPHPGMQQWHCSITERAWLLGRGFSAQLQHGSDRAVLILVPGPAHLFCSSWHTEVSCAQFLNQSFFIQNIFAHLFSPLSHRNNFIYLHVM